MVNPDLTARMEEAVSALNARDFVRFERASEGCTPSPLNGALCDYRRFIDEIGGLGSIPASHIDLMIEDLRDAHDGHFLFRSKDRFKIILTEASQSVAKKVAQGSIADPQASKTIEGLTYSGPTALEFVAKEEFFKHVAGLVRENPKLLEFLEASYPASMKRFYRSFERALGRLPEEKHNTLHNPFMDPRRADFQSLAEWGKDFPSL